MASAAEQLAANLNFSSFSKADELKKRIWFTLGALIVYRLGTYVPLPGIDPTAFAASFKGQSQGIAGLFNMFRGGRAAHGHFCPEHHALYFGVDYCAVVDVGHSAA